MLSNLSFFGGIVFAAAFVVSIFSKTKKPKSKNSIPTIQILKLPVRAAIGWAANSTFLVARLLVKLSVITPINFGLSLKIVPKNINLGQDTKARHPLGIISLIYSNIKLAGCIGDISFGILQGVKMGNRAITNGTKVLDIG